MTEKFQNSSEMHTLTILELTKKQKIKKQHEQRCANAWANRQWNKKYSLCTRRFGFFRYVAFLSSMQYNNMNVD